MGKTQSGVAIYEATTGRFVRGGFASKTDAKASVDAELRTDAGRERWFDIRDKFDALSDDVIDSYRTDNELETDEERSNEISKTDVEAVSGATSFSVYDDMRSKLIAAGIKPNEIAFIHDYPKPKQKAELFARVNAGDVRVLLGTTQKMGAGTNVNARLVALHNVDAPWRPSDLEQREGRIIRQGNELYAADPEGFEVYIGRYATEQTYDTRRWQILEHKARGIEQLRKYSGTGDIEGETTNEAANSSDMKAAASGNPLILEETRLANEVKRLTLLRRAYSDSVNSLAMQKTSAKDLIDRYYPSKIQEFERLLEIVNKNPLPAATEAGDELAPMVINGKTVNDKKAAIAEITKTAAKAHLDGQGVTLIAYRGLNFKIDHGVRGSTISANWGRLDTWRRGDAISPSGLITRLNNAIESVANRLAQAISGLAYEKESLAKLESIDLKGFDKETELINTTLEHKAIQRKLSASSSLDAVPQEEREEYLSQLEDRKNRLRSIGFGDALAESQLAKESQSNTEVTNPATVDELLARINPRSKIFTVYAKAADVPGNVSARLQGHYDPVSDSIVLVAETIDKSEIDSVLYHEALHRAEAVDPTHIQTTARFERDMQDQFDKAAIGIGHKEVVAAYTRAVNSGAEDTMAEFRAYIVSEFARAPASLPDKIVQMVKKFIGGIRAVLIRSGLDFGKIRSLTPADLYALSKYGLKAPKSPNANGGPVQQSVKDFFTGGPRGTDSLADIDTIIRTGKMPTRAADRQALFDKATTLFIDSTRPFDALMRQFPDSWRVVRDKDLARRKVSVKEKEVVTQFLRPLTKVISAVAKESNLDFRAAKELIGQWMTARYAIEKNGDYLRQDAAKVAEAEKALADKIAKDKHDLAYGIIDAEPTNAELKAAVTRAKTAQRERFDAIHEDRFIDARLEGLSAKLAGGYNNFTAQEMMSRYESVIPKDKLEAAANIVYAMMRWKVKLDLDTGKVTKAQVADWFNSPHYVPLTGDPSVDTSEDELFAHGGVNQTGDKQALGRSESIAKNGIDAAVEQVQKSARYYGWSDFKESLSELYDRLIQDEIDSGATAAEAKENVSKHYHFTKTRLTDGFVSDTGITYRKNGEQWVFDLHNAEAIDALKSINKEQIPSLLQPFAFFTRSYARFVTQFMPGFGLINSIRDTWERTENIRARVIPGYEFLDMGSVANLALKNAAHVGIVKKLMAVMLEGTGLEGKIAIDNSDPDIQSIRLMIESGATSTVGDYISSDSATLSEKLKSLSGWSDSAMSYVTAWNNAFELVASHSIFSSLMTHGVDAKTAAAATLNLMNFGKSGTITGPLRALYTFVNPVMQGGHQLAQTLNTSTGRARATAYFLAGVALYAMLRAVDGDDDITGENKMDNISAFMLERNIHLPFGNDLYLKVPIGFGMPQAMWGAATNVGKMMFGNQSVADTLVEITKSFTRTLAPVAPSEASILNHPVIWMAQTFSPQIAKPLVNVGLDVSMFGQPLTNSRFARDDKALALQGRKTTPEFYKTIARELGAFGINVYPETVREIIRGYAVGPLNEILKVAVENPTKEKFGRNTIPVVIDRFVAAHDSGYLKDRLYYRYRDEMNDAAVKRSLDRDLTPRESELAKLQDIVKKLENKANGKLSSATKAKDIIKAQTFRAEGERIRDSAKTLTIKTMRRLDDD